MIVVDASVAAKWYLNEPGSAEAASLLTCDDALIAPALIRVEVTGAILRRYREKKLSEGRAKEACELWDADLAGGAIRQKSMLFGNGLPQPRGSVSHRLPGTQRHLTQTIPQLGLQGPAMRLSLRL